MRIVSVVAARPQFIKLNPVSAALADHGVEHLVIHTGQQYDEKISEGIFRGLQIPTPDVNPEVGSGSQGEQTGRILIRIKPLLQDLEPDWVLVCGDTNSTVAAALAAVKVGMKAAHIEAGL